LKLKYDELLTNFAFQLSLRHYNKEVAPVIEEALDNRQGLTDIARLTDDALTPRHQTHFLVSSVRCRPIDQ
jgi:hypothetical protein